MFGSIDCCTSRNGTPAERPQLDDSTQEDDDPHAIELKFAHGGLGLHANWRTGLVEEVGDGQGKDMGVKVGWKFAKVNGNEYTQQLLDETNACTDDYFITFEAPKEVVTKRKADAPGWYVITFDLTTVGPDILPSQKKVAELSLGQRVLVKSIFKQKRSMRLRARIDDPAGWISLENTETGFRWAEREDEGHMKVQLQHRAQGVWWKFAGSLHNACQPQKNPRTRRLVDTDANGVAQEEKETQDDPEPREKSKEVVDSDAQAKPVADHRSVDEEAPTGKKKHGSKQSLLSSASVRKQATEKQEEKQATEVEPKEKQGDDAANAKVKTDAGAKETTDTQAKEKADADVKEKHPDADPKEEHLGAEVKEELDVAAQQKRNVKAKKEAIEKAEAEAQKQAEREAKRKADIKAKELIVADRKAQADAEAKLRTAMEAEAMKQIDSPKTKGSRKKARPVPEGADAEVVRNAE